MAAIPRQARSLFATRPLAHPSDRCHCPNHLTPVDGEVYGDECSLGPRARPPGRTEISYREGGIWWAVNVVWELWRFNLAAKFATRNPGVKSKFLLPRLRRKRKKRVFWECPPNLPQPNETQPI